MSDKDLQSAPRKTKPLPAAIARPLAASAYLSVSRSTLHRLVKDGKLRPVQIGARARGYLYTDLDAFLAAATAA